MTHSDLNRSADADAESARDDSLGDSSRRRLLRRGVWLSAVVVVWNVVEGIVAITAGVLASSVALISFGVDSGVEVGSAAVVLWRFRRELRGKMTEKVEQLERRTARITGGLLFLLAAYIVIDAGRRLLGYGAEAETSMIGIVMTSLSLLVMPLLGWAKLRTADQLQSPSFRADAFETITCAWLSAATLAGLALNAAFGWAWADPLAALVIVPLVIREGREGWQGESCCDE